jgi:O-methyltransferase
VIPFWEEDAAFDKLNRQIIGYTLVDKTRCWILYQSARQVASLAGDIGEVGVFKGGTAKLLAKTAAQSKKTLHLFDTFLGMPETDPEKDIHKAGDFSDTSLERVQAFLSDCDNVRFYQGIFPHTSGPIEQTPFSMVHVDVDIYQSVIDCCRFFYPRVIRGGLIIFDDYGFLSCPGVKKAVDEFFLDKPEEPIYLPTGQCMAIRL